jgi:methionyl-tRNA formyltransferase
MNIVFMGSPEFAVASLNAILSSKHTVKLVVSQPDKPANRGQKITPCAVAEFASGHKLELARPQTLKNNSEILDRLKKNNPDVIVVVAYGKILPREILGLPKFGCVNLHASLLPKYRGAAPINWAIINGEGVSGVTTMFMNEKMDEGDILLQCQTDIMPHDTASDLHDHLAVIGAELLVKTLDMLEKGTLKGVPQEDKKATYGPKLKKEDGLIDWKRSAQGIYNRIRGLQPWPRAYTHFPSPSGGEGEGGILFIYDAAAVEVDNKKDKPGTIVSLDKGIIVTTGFGQLCILEVQQAGKKRMPAIEFIKGNKLKVGERFL